MEITGSAPDRDRIELVFLKPLRSTQRRRVRRSRRPATAPRSPGGCPASTKGDDAALFSKVMAMDRLIGKDFEKGLARLKAAAEAP